MAFPVRGIGDGHTDRVRLLIAKRWAVTLAATGVSIYVLDVTATLAGVALVASDILGDLDILSAAMALLASYVAWAFGLRANLNANWELLERTGISTNCLSKATYDAAKFSGLGEGARKFASNSGYVVVELGKEAPYYAAAFGAAAFSEIVSSQDALIFLCGTNIGAACYEYGLARATQALLTRSDASV